MRALITGASYGLGLDLAKVFLNHGYKLLLIARSKDRLLEIKKELDKDDSIDIFPCDLTINPKEIAEELTKKYDDIEVVINNAGIGLSGDILSHNIEDETRLIDLNIKALTIFTITFGNYFKKKDKGSILNISSVGSMMPGKYMASYYASKSYVSSLSYSISLELKKTNINIIAFNLPRMNTKFDLHSNRSGNLKKGVSPIKIANKIYKYRYKRGIKNIGTSVKLTNLLSHILPKGVFAHFIGDKLR